MDKKRRLKSWVEAFSKQCTTINTPFIWRQWVGISVLAACVEQKLWMVSGGKALYPNMYIFLVGHPGSGKTRTIMEGRSYLNRLPEPHFAPNDATWPSILDCLCKNSRLYLRPVEGDLKYNSLYLCVDELGTLMSKYDTQVTKGLSALYDPNPYHHTRRTGNLELLMECPQINLIIGTTPQDLLDFLPESAWGQGFMSRTVMVFSDERIVGDDFAPMVHSLTDDLDHDLGMINETFGQFVISPGWYELVNSWRQEGEVPVPDHPRLIHYNSRRKVNIYKLSMVSSIDRGQSLTIEVEDFARAHSWLTAAEAVMPDIFRTGIANADGKAIQEIKHFVLAHDVGWGVSEQKIVYFAKDLLPIQTLVRVIDTMIKTGDLFYLGTDKVSGLKFYSAQAQARPPEAT